MFIWLVYVVYCFRAACFSGSVRRLRAAAPATSPASASRLRSAKPELCHSYPCPCPSQFVEHPQVTNGCSMMFVLAL